MPVTTHCEERGDEAISIQQAQLADDCFVAAFLAMTVKAFLRAKLALAIAWLAYGLFYLTVLALVVGIPIGLMVFLAHILLP